MPEQMPASPATPIAEAAALLLAVRRGAARLAALPAHLRPHTLAEAYAIQSEVLRGLNSEAGGWKATLFDARHGICAPLATGSLLPSPAQLATLATATRNTDQFGIEPEIAFLMGTDLAPRALNALYSADEVYAAVASAHAVIEIVVSRYLDADAVSQLERVADNFMNEALVIGPPCALWRELALRELPLRVQVDGTGVHSAAGGHPLGDPLLPLVWIANHLAGLGRGLRRGEYVTTGSCNGVRHVSRGQFVEVSFAILGTASIRC
jgi:2-keto-4-pentenoate hydratase